MPTLHPAKSESAWRVFMVFLRLGLTSFGGPIAHLSYFRLEFVERRRWLTDRSYSDLVALCQFLPGPASSQVGMALGLARAGWLGLLAVISLYVVHPGHLWKMVVTTPLQTPKSPDEPL
ncbi:chromate transporter [Stenotrophomonas maltophilia]|uniref:chromate transporter n=1 Tax=Stenotrophomonas maltophilia TaxID=40324 RepID=UPI002E79777B|nr:chromate transporter [Stenotrophomonas maltophilia]